MPVLRTAPRTAAMILLAGVALAAQQSPSYTLKIAGGPTFGGLLSPLGRAGYSLGADFEVAWSAGADSRLVAGLGWRSFPGDYVNVSFIPYSYPATGVNPTIYETRVRKPEGQGFQLTGLYRRGLPLAAGLYLQGGLRIGSHKLSETDTGTQLVTDGRASTASGNVLAVNTIATVREKTTLSAGLLAGIGYEFQEFTFELNLWSASLESPTLGKKNGVASELAFGFRF